MFIWSFLAAFVGGKLLFYLEDPSKYFKNPSLMIQNLGNGFVFYGSLLVQYELNDKGFVSHTSLYPYENIKSFWVQRENFPAPGAEKLKPMLFIKSERFFMPIILAPIESYMTEEIHSYLLEKNVVEEEMKENIILMVI